MAATRTPDLPSIEVDIDRGTVCGIPVETGPVPEHLAGATATSGMLDADDRRVLLRSKAARVLVEDGRRIVIDPCPASVGDDLGFLHYGWMPSLVMLWRGCVFLHATTVRRGVSTIAIAGRSGSGKSTAAACLLAGGGWELCCDDTAPIVIRGRVPWVVPYGRPIHLLPDAARRAPPTATGPVRLPFRGKSAFSVPQDLTPGPLTGVVVLGVGDRPEGLVGAPRPSRRILRGNALGGLEAFSALARNVHARAALRTPGRRAGLLRWLEGVATVPTHLIERPEGTDSLAEVVAAIDAFAAGHGGGPGSAAAR